jgi:hypothetical protein
MDCVAGAANLTSNWFGTDPRLIALQGGFEIRTLLV